LFLRLHLKGHSAWALFKAHPEIKSQLWNKHLWNPSYFITTVSDISYDQIKEYISSQKER
jgi:putative transposase